MLHDLQNNHDLKESFPLLWIMGGMFCIAMNFIDLKVIDCEVLTPYVHILQIVFLGLSIIAITKQIFSWFNFDDYIKK